MTAIKRFKIGPNGDMMTDAYGEWCLYVDHENEFYVLENTIMNHEGENHDLVLKNESLEAELIPFRKCLSVVSASERAQIEVARELIDDYETRIKELEARISNFEKGMPSKEEVNSALKFDDLEVEYSEENDPEYCERCFRKNGLMDSISRGGRGMSEIKRYSPEEMIDELQGASEDVVFYKDHAAKVAELEARLAKEMT